MTLARVSRERLPRGRATCRAGNADQKPHFPKPAVLTNRGRELELQLCDVKGVTKEALCCQYEVYEDRAKKSFTGAD